MLQYAWQSKKLPGLLLLICVCGAGCRAAPFTGRRQLVFLPESQEVALGATAFQEVTANEPSSSNAYYQEVVQRVGQRIAAVAQRPDYQWEFRVIASPTQNAFCLPGGKVAVYEGILPVCETEAGLAVVMSHEVAHALARHGGERMSQGYAVELGKQGVSLLTGKYAESKRDMILKSYGVASQYGIILPYSREHESEADHIGLMLLAKAGYDPAEAPRFWQRFAASQQGNPPMEFLSTHPSDARRSEDLAALLPQAMQSYDLAPTKYGLGETLKIAALPASPSPAAAADGAARTAVPVSSSSAAAAGPESSGRTGSGLDARSWLPPPIRSSP